MSHFIWHNFCQPKLLNCGWTWADLLGDGRRAILATYNIQPNPKGKVAWILRTGKPALRNGRIIFITISPLLLPVRALQPFRWNSLGEAKMPMAETGQFIMEGIGELQRQVSSYYINRDGGEHWSVIGPTLVNNPILAPDVSKLPSIFGNQGSLVSPLWRQKTCPFPCSPWLPDTVSSTVALLSLKWIPTLIALPLPCALL